MSKDQLIEVAKQNLAHAQAGTIQQTPDFLKVPAEHYYATERWQAEMDKIFKRVPLLLATTAEMPNPGDYKAMDAAGTPVLLSRTPSGEVQAFFNMCSHRGAQIMPEGVGNTHRFTCPYHAWTYNLQGDLTAIYANKDFGDLDKTCHSLTPLPCLERAGLIWVTLNQNSTLPIKHFFPVMTRFWRTLTLKVGTILLVKRLRGLTGKSPMTVTWTYIICLFYIRTLLGLTTQTERTIITGGLISVLRGLTQGLQNTKIMHLRTGLSALSWPESGPSFHTSLLPVSREVGVALCSLSFFLALLPALQLRPSTTSWKIRQTRRRQRQQRSNSNF